MKDLDKLLRMSDETLQKIIKSAQTDLFYEIVRSIKEVESSEEIEGAMISQLIELRFRDRF